MPQTTCSDLIGQELSYQQNQICLLAASNILSENVRKALDPQLMQIHAEGYPGKRYHEGQSVGEAIETRAQDLACELFSVESANVQPYRGTLANNAAAFALARPGDVLLGFDCKAGGHYSTSTKAGLIGQLFRVETYGIDAQTFQIDYDKILSKLKLFRPKILFCGDTSYSGLWDFEFLIRAAKEHDCFLVADLSQTIGLIAGGQIDCPTGQIDVITAATYKTLRGPRAGLILSKNRFKKSLEQALSPLFQGGPDISKIAGLAVCFEEAGTSEFQQYAKRVIENSKLMAGTFKSMGYKLVGDRTENHAFMLDLTEDADSGQALASLLAEANIISNGNQIPFETGGLRSSKGLRLGTPWITSLGVSNAEVVKICHWVDRILKHRQQPEVVQAVRKEVLEFTRAFRFRE